MALLDEIEEQANKREVHGIGRENWKQLGNFLEQLPGDFSDEESFTYSYDGPEEGLRAVRDQYEIVHLMGTEKLKKYASRVLEAEEPGEEFENIWQDYHSEGFYNTIQKTARDLIPGF